MKNVKVFVVLLFIVDLFLATSLVAMTGLPYGTVVALKAIHYNTYLRVVDGKHLRADGKSNTDPECQFTILRSGSWVGLFSAFAGGVLQTVAADEVQKGAVEVRFENVFFKRDNGTYWVPDDGASLKLVHLKNENGLWFSPHPPDTTTQWSDGFPDACINYMCKGYAWADYFLGNGTQTAVRYNKILGPGPLVAGPGTWERLAIEIIPDPMPASEQLISAPAPSSAQGSIAMPSPSYRSLLLGDGWVNAAASYASSRVCREGAVVALSGKVAVTSDISWTKPIAILPEGFRPPKRLVFSVNAGVNQIRVDVLPDGTILCDPNYPSYKSFEAAKVSGWVSLTGITFSVVDDYVVSLTPPPGLRLPAPGITVQPSNMTPAHYGGAYGSVTIHKEGSIVIVSGAVLCPGFKVVGNGLSILAHLPKGYRPLKRLVFNSFAGGGAWEKIARVDVDPAEGISVCTPQEDSANTNPIPEWVNLTGIIFSTQEGASLPGVSNFGQYEASPGRELTYAPVTYQKIGSNLCLLQGLVSAISPRTTIGTLPPGYFPPENVTFVASGNQHRYSASITLDGKGVLTLDASGSPSSSAVSLSGIVLPITQLIGNLTQAKMLNVATATKETLNSAVTALLPAMWSDADAARKLDEVTNEQAKRASPLLAQLKPGTIVALRSLYFNNNYLKVVDAKNVTIDGNGVEVRYLRVDGTATTDPACQFEVMRLGNWLGFKSYVATGKNLLAVPVTASGTDKGEVRFQNYDFFNDTNTWQHWALVPEDPANLGLVRLKNQNGGWFSAHPPIKPTDTSDRCDNYMCQGHVWTASEVKASGLTPTGPGVWEKLAIEIIKPVPGDMQPGGPTYTHIGSVAGSNLQSAATWKIETPGSGWVKFKARGTQDLYVAFGDSVVATGNPLVVTTAKDFWATSEIGGRYYIGVGQGFNTWTRIGKLTSNGWVYNDPSTNKNVDLALLINSVNQNGMVTGGTPDTGLQWDDYWFAVNNGTVSWGKGVVVGSNELQRWVDPSPLTTVQYVYLGCWRAAKMEFKDIQFSTGDPFQSVRDLVWAKALVAVSANDADLTKALAILSAASLDTKAIQAEQAKRVDVVWAKSLVVVSASDADLTKALAILSAASLDTKAIQTEQAVRQQAATDLAWAEALVIASASDADLTKAVTILTAAPITDTAAATQLKAVQAQQATRQQVAADKVKAVQAAEALRQQAAAQAASLAAQQKVATDLAWAKALVTTNASTADLTKAATILGAAPATDTVAAIKLAAVINYKKCEEQEQLVGQARQMFEDYKKGQTDQKRGVLDALLMSLMNNPMIDDDYENYVIEPMLLQVRLNVFDASAPPVLPKEEVKATTPVVVAKKETVKIKKTELKKRAQQQSTTTKSTSKTTTQATTKTLSKVTTPVASPKTQQATGKKGSPGSVASTKKETTTQKQPIKKVAVKKTDSKT